MKQKKVNRVALLLHWAGEQKAWLFLAVFLSAAGGLCIVVPYMGIYQLMDAAFSGTCTTKLVVRIAAMKGRLRGAVQGALHGGGAHGPGAPGGVE